MKFKTMSVHSGQRIDPQTGALTTPLYQSDPANQLFYQVGENVLKGRLRSHPDVAARHYGPVESARLPRTESEAITA